MNNKFNQEKLQALRIKVKETLEYIESKYGDFKADRENARFKKLLEIIYDDAINSDEFIIKAKDIIDN
jgi:hypothetical protein